MFKEQDTGERRFARDSDDLAFFHESVAAAFESGLAKIGRAFALTFGERAAHAALHALLAHAEPLGLGQGFRAQFDKLGWREYLALHALDSIELTVLWREGAEYAGQGIAPRERPDSNRSLQSRKTRIETLIEAGLAALECSSAILGDAYDFVWKGVKARAALDFGGKLTLEGVELLSGLSRAVVRNAVSMGELNPDESGNVTSEEAKRWLSRRREFCPSRWLNLDDNQWPFDPSRLVDPDDTGMVWVPGATEGDIFIPDRVIRHSREGLGISITIGAKGQERQYQDFYQALAALASMDVARWRRPNASGNWGIVRARGAWVAFPKKEIDRQLAEKYGSASHSPRRDNRLPRQ